MSDQPDSRQVFPNIPEDTPQSLSILGTMRRWLGNYYPYPVRLAEKVLMRKSLRVGSGTSLAAFDGTDGAIISNGTSGMFVGADRTTPAAYFGWVRPNGTIQLFSIETNPLWDINATSGIIAQSAWTSATLLNTFAQGGPWATCAYVQTKPDGRVHIRGGVTHATGAGFNTAIFNIPSALRPATQLPLVGVLNTGAAFSAAPMYLGATGDVTPLVNVPTPASTGYLAVFGSWLPGQ